MNWQTIVISVISNALFIGVATAVVNYFFNKKLESVKNEAAIFILKYQTLHTKRAEAVYEIYAALDKANRYMSDAMNPWQMGGKSVKNKALEAQDAGNEFLDTYSAKKIYLKPSLEKRLDETHLKIKQLWTEFVRSNPDLNNGTHEDWGQWQKAWEAFSRNDIPPMVAKLKAEFRNILGSDLD